MKRSRYWLIAISLTVALAACGEKHQPVEVPLPVLVSQQAAYQDTLIATQGVVRGFDNPVHYWIEDQDLNRVEIFPHEKIASYLGQEVRVIGRFSYASDKGRALTLENLEVVSGAPE